MDGQFPVLTGHSVASARARDGQARLTVTTPSGSSRELLADHVIAATGYRADVARMEFLGDQIRRQVQTVAGTPAVGRDYQSSVPGLYFIGPAVAPTFGPVMRFVFGSRHAATVVSRQLAAAADRGSRRTVAAGR